MRSMNDLLHIGPSGNTLSQMFPTSHRARVSADFRLIASVRPMYQVFPYLVLRRACTTTWVQL